ncbi:hypothetical protein V3C33_05850 [Micrococcaceae bacterium Sec5.7]
MTRKWLRWMPAVAAPAVIAAAVLAGSVPARAGDPLPAKTPEQVLELVAQHSTQSLSGTLEQSSGLGLPELPAKGPNAGAGGTSVIELLSGPHTARVFLDGAANARIQVLDQLGERDAVRKGSELWFYTSKNNTATHITIPAVEADRQKPPAGMHGVMPTPAELAGKMLAAIDPSTVVSLGPQIQVAGRSAYNLVLTPRAPGTLVGSVSMAVDGQTGLPLSVEIDARGQREPAFRIAFSSLTLAAPDASLFTFNPPPGATVKELEKPAVPHPAPKAPGETRTPGKDPTSPHGAGSATRPTVTGSGWETVVAFPPGGDSTSIDSMLSDPLLKQATVAVSGGRLLSTSLVNVLLTDNGSIFAGMVPPERLQAAATAAK